MKNWGETLADLGTALTAIGWIFLPFCLLPLLYIFLPNNRFIKTFSEALIRLIDSLSYIVGEIVKWGLPILVITVAVSVFALSIFGLSWTKLFESAEYLHACVIMLGAAVTLLAGQHVRVDIFHTNMSAKSRGMVDFVGFYALLLPACLIILWNSQSFISFSWKIFEGSAEADGIRGEFLLKTLIPSFCVAMILQGLAIATRAAMCLHDQAQPERPPHTPAFFTKQDMEH